MSIESVNAEYIALRSARRRELFELFFAGSRRNRGPRHRPAFERFDGDGTYKDDHTQRHWWTWQQAILASDAEENKE